ncbi:MAG: hypothetical protein COT81_00330 [Candidatus Buchananbacteria bacterium CG10_big_fil_rev_8_21_14_0_10_42_9]|uniref:Uncharacterized protein n=1 Tax=Candidatus Buchananbacteria bacterium CG10_big_fil_rev_8_21_14_0_10_42_9 TaxID=1974526 RepID=A0A2H0W2J1_9BACT|nr:MAG: hypothetical protein COT81_00330 [Candidatus Buchananbacteria bacterium CG10_big_fil_rev_8_21_14_0_10_42_9]
MNVKQKFYLTIAFFMLFTVGVVFFILLPTAQEVMHLSNLINDERAELERKYQAGQRLNETVRALEEIREQKIILDSVFIASGAEAEFSSELERIADQHRIIQTLQAEPPANNQFRLTQVLEGNYYNMLNYLVALESLSVYMNAKQVNLTIANVSDANVVKALLRTESFILPK